MRNDGLALLLVDDEPFAAPLYKQHLEHDHQMSVFIETDAKRAKERALAHLFDILVIDAKIDYRGTMHGGLLLANELVPRYGAHSIIVTSQYVTSLQLELFGLSLPFIMKPRRGGVAHYAEQIASCAKDLVSDQFVFAAMGYSAENLELFSTSIEPGFHAMGFKTLVQKDIPHGKNIIAMMYDAIRKAKMLVLVADGQNANAYMEAGFADGLEKEVLVIGKSQDDLLFDIRQRNALFHNGNADDLIDKIRLRLKGLRFPSMNLQQ
jgi:CheY-like chemotaxis protein